MKALLRSSIFALVRLRQVMQPWPLDISKPHSNAGCPSTAVSASCTLRDWQVTPMRLPGLRLKGVGHCISMAYPWQTLDGVY